MIGNYENRQILVLPTGEPSTGFICITIVNAVRLVQLVTRFLRRPKVSSEIEERYENYLIITLLYVA